MGSFLIIVVVVQGEMDLRLSRFDLFGEHKMSLIGKLVLPRHMPAAQGAA
jgi:hypothetical protein